ncbi:MAG: cadherin-like beta sandwich domain-containing protein [Clostridiales bacterium]|nr:cadherin-like beta sandwich domain-containing protein [Clostridiales bacterium]
MKLKKYLLPGSIFVSIVLILSLGVSMFLAAAPVPAHPDLTRAACYTAEEGNIARLTSVRQITNTRPLDNNAVDTAARYNPTTGAGVDRPGINANYLNPSYSTPTQATHGILRVTNGIRPTSGSSNGYLSWSYTDHFSVSNRLYFIINWGTPYVIDAVRCDWWTDSNVTVPNSEAKVEWLDGTEWKEVTNMKNGATGADVTNIPTATMGNWNSVTFDPVTTTQLRLKLYRSGTITNGIGLGEWEVFGVPAGPPDNNADLASLSVNQGTLTPAFAAATTSYTVSVASSVSSINISASAAGIGATIEGTGSKSLAVGENPFAVKVTSGDTTVSKTYNIVVTRVVAADPVTVTLNPQGGTVDPASLSVTPGEEYGVLPRPAFSGFSFNGWFTAATGGTLVTAASIVPAGAHTLYAQWSAVPKVGNEHLQKNLENFPTMWNEATGQIRSIFSNDNVINEVVWVETPLDTDMDGKRDLMRVVIRRPVETLPENGGLKCPAIINISPYETTTTGGVLFIGFSDRIYEGFPAQGPAATRFQHTAFKARPAGMAGVLSDRSHWTKIYGPENDKSYRALRNVTERRVGKGAEATVAPYKDLLADGMLDATVYTAEQAADYPWLPPARTPTGSQRDGTTYSTSPGAAGPWSTATMIQRGYAVLRYRITGSDYSEGFLQYGMYQESLAGAAVIDWLNGRVRGYADRDGLVEVKAYWATGEAAASGTSYEGTMPMAAAVTGVEGLRTIFTGAPVTNAYNYYRENGMPYAPGGYVGEDLNAITMYCAGRMVTTGAPAYPTPITSPIWDNYWDWLLYLTSEQDATTGDYSPAWDERNPLSFGADFRKDLGVIMGHGFNDGNVKFRHTALLNETLKFYGVEVVKGLFHQGGHGMGNARSGAWTTTAIMTDWADHYLYGVENGIVERTPTYSVEGNTLGSATGSWRNYDIWPRGNGYQKFYPQGGRVGTISTVPPSTSTSVTFQDDYLTKVTYPQNYDDSYYINGVNGLASNRQHLRANGLNSANGALDNLLLVRGQGAASALTGSQRPIWRNMLVGGLEGVTTAWSGTEQRLLYTSSALTSQFSKTKEIKDRVLFLKDIEEEFTISGFTKMTAEIAASKDVGAISAMLLEWGTSSVKIVAMGSIDVRNPNPDGTIAPDVPGLANIEKGGNWHANYLFQPVDIIPYGISAPTAANFNSYTWEMDVSEYKFTKGNQMGIILYGSDPDFTYITRDATEFTVNLGPNTYLSLPIVQATAEKPATVEVADVMAKPGDLVDVTYKIKDNAFGFAALDLKIPYNSSIYTPQTITPAGAVNTMFFVANPVFAPGMMRIAFAADENVKNDVLLFTVTYKVADSAPGVGDYPLEVEPVKLQYLSGLGHLVDLEVAIKAGTLVIGILGDVDGDGFVTPEDAMLILQMIVGLKEWTPRALLLGDVNGDGVVDTTDAALILRMVVGG